MPVTYIYRIPLFDAYRYSLVERDLLRPDELDEEGTIYQIITTGEGGRLAKSERYFDGELSTARMYFYEGDKPVREEEFYSETGTKSEVRFTYRPDGFTKEYYTAGELDRTEAYTQNARGVAVACREKDAAGEEGVSWEANEKGDRVHLRDGEREAFFEHRYGDDGLVAESISRDGRQSLRETYLYQNGRVARHAVFGRGFRPGDEDPEDGAGEVLVSEETVETDPRGTYEVRRRKQLVASRSAGEGRDAKYWPSRIEILYDERKRITDVLACDHELVLPPLGINCEANAYYFFEYED